MTIRSQRNELVLIDGVERVGGGYVGKLDLDNDYRLFYPDRLWEEVPEEQWEPVDVMILEGGIGIIIGSMKIDLPPTWRVVRNRSGEFPSVRFERKVL